VLDGLPGTLVAKHIAGQTRSVMFKDFVANAWTDPAQRSVITVDRHVPLGSGSNPRPLDDGLRVFTLERINALLR
jgi:hypothetical protein